MKYVIYTRVSTAEQAKGDSLDAQKDLCMQIVPPEANVTAIQDASSGGKDFDKRAQLKAAIELLSKGDILVVYKFDRLCRDFDQMGYINTLVSMRKAKIVSVLEQDIDRAMRGFKSLVADMERVHIRERIKNALYYKKKLGRRVGHIPFGYCVRENKKLEKSESEQSTLETMIKLTDQGYSLRQIAHYLNENNLLNRDEKQWSHVSIYKILGNREKHVQFVH